MGRIREDNFGNDGAMAYLAMLIARLVASITEVVGDETRLEPDEDGESMLMPSVEILALLCERYGAEPPRPDTVREWSSKYLAAFDRATEPARARPGFKAARRKVVENTFRWLEGLSESFWVG
jgi:hypothetical protein